MVESCAFCMIDFTVVLVPKDESGCKFIGSSELVQFLMRSSTLAGTIIRCEDIKNAGATATQKESVIEMATAAGAYIFNPERCFSLIGKSDPSAAKLWFEDSEHPFHRLCGTKE